MITRLLPALLPLALMACGSKNTEISISSDGFATSSAATSASLAEGAAGADVTSLRFCVTRLKLEGWSTGASPSPSPSPSATSSPNALTGDDDDRGDDDDDASSDSHERSFAIGEVTLDGPAKEWSRIEIPAGFRAKHIKIKVHQNPALCPNLGKRSLEVVADGVARATQQDIEFKWKFKPAIELDQGTLVLSMNEVIAALRLGDLNSLKQVIEGVEGSCRKK